MLVKFNDGAKTVKCPCHLMDNPRKVSIEKCKICPFHNSYSVAGVVCYWRDWEEAEDKGEY